VTHRFRPASEIGYGLEIGGVSGETGGRRLIAASLLALITAAIAFLAYARLHDGRTESLFGEAEAENERRQLIQEERQERDRERRKAEAENAAQNPNTHRLTTRRN
jgi:hypothetical protein